MREAILGTVRTKDENGERCQRPAPMKSIPSNRRRKLTGALLSVGVVLMKGGDSKGLAFVECTLYYSAGFATLCVLALACDPKFSQYHDFGSEFFIGSSKGDRITIFCILPRVL